MILREWSLKTPSLEASVVSLSSRAQATCQDFSQNLIHLHGAHYDSTWSAQMNVYRFVQPGQANSNAKVMHAVSLSTTGDLLVSVHDPTRLAVDPTRATTSMVVEASAFKELVGGPLGARQAQAHPTGTLTGWQHRPRQLSLTGHVLLVNDMRVLVGYATSGDIAPLSYFILAEHLAIDLPADSRVLLDGLQAILPSQVHLLPPPGLPGQDGEPKVPSSAATKVAQALLALYRAKQAI
ncbi:uncharacterized protein L969DRAFT_96515 [Mixia osmundae IAM 14324]|uniref:Uncharacterized protein n=1 Tax=Mixia osmundae (strain CBS 9802 / IAM 14324 / JCM 22182 / KY 12970) TaxID=764103 RepID=G7DUT5_MIXOS|nr:uncharacterized protein L969DRAFT_96515 [Mixia osmundae IAM 14324]KEI37437.1 hypothetical protein L969DRAFT_96515 [Mixia osmundae IAM 14324]GAA94345.1 hypothetical protein E5Q_00996 [Mixia osmundae IAM 14324]